MSTGVDQAVPQDGPAAQMPVSASGGVGVLALRDAVAAALARLAPRAEHGAEPGASPSWGGGGWTATAVRANHDRSTTAGGGSSASGATAVAAIVVLLDRVVDAAIVEHAKRWAQRYAHGMRAGLRPLTGHWLDEPRAEPNPFFPCPACLSILASTPSW